MNWEKLLDYGANAVVTVVAGAAVYFYVEIENLKTDILELDARTELALKKQAECEGLGQRIVDLQIDPGFSRIVEQAEEVFTKRGCVVGIQEGNNN